MRQIPPTSRRTPIRFTGLIALFIATLVGSVPLMADDNLCMDCHSDNTLTGLNHAGSEISMFVDADTLDNSSHSGFSCVDCHTDLAGFEDFPHAEELQPVDCGTCHSDVNEIFLASAHATARTTFSPNPILTRPHRQRISHIPVPAATTNFA